MSLVSNEFQLALAVLSSNYMRTGVPAVPRRLKRKTGRFTYNIGVGSRRNYSVIHGRIPDEKEDVHSVTRRPE